ncbi:MAG: hypothetical protein C4303_07215 [candidate division GAL15 bacterium]
MRVAAGEAKGKRLRVPRGVHARPTQDRVREAIFNALGSRVVDAAAGIRGLRCWTWCYGDCSVGAADRVSGVHLNVGYVAGEPLGESG